MTWMTYDPDFKVTTFFEVEYHNDKVTIAQEESIPNIWNGTMFGDLDWPLNASLGFVSISWASCFAEYQIDVLCIHYSVCIVYRIRTVCLFCATAVRCPIKTRPRFIHEKTQFLSLNFQSALCTRLVVFLISILSAVRCGKRTKCVVTLCCLHYYAPPLG